MPDRANFSFGRFDAIFVLRALLVLSILVPVAVFAGTAYLNYTNALEDARRQLLSSVDVVHEHTVKVFETHALVADQVDELLRGLSDEEIREREAALRERVRATALKLPQIQDLWVIGTTGQALLSANVYPVPRNVDFSDRDYVVVHKRNPKSPLHIGDILIGRIDPSRVFFQVSRPRVGPDGSYAGVISVSVEPGYFRNFFRRFVNDEPGAFAALVRADGARLARIPDPNPGPFRIPPNSAFLNAIAMSPDRGIYETVSSTTSIDSIVAYSRLSDHPVYIAIALPRKVVVSEWLSGVLMQLAFGIPATLALAGVTLVALRRTQRERAAVRRAGEEARRRQKAEERLQQSQKMEAIGQLTGGVAHDFNNLLTVIVGGLDVILKAPDRPERVRRFAEAAITAANRGARLTEQLLAFARRQTLRPEIVDAGALLKEIKPLLRRAVGEAIQLEFRREDEAAVKVDPAQFEAALLNLVVNARDATPPGGSITITLDTIAVGPSDPRDLGPGEYVRVSVRDTGEGMTPDVLARVYEPFFTTKEVGRGSGLGLSQVYGFARQSEGGVTIDSSPGRGTNVSIFLPRSRDLMEAQVEAKPDGLTGLNATILLTEDDNDVRGMTTEALRDLGHNVVVAENGPQALDILRSRSDIDLLFTDIVMPQGVSGLELAEQAQALYPAIRVLLTSGYAADNLVGDVQTTRRYAFLRKPYRTADLARAIEATLAAPVGQAPMLAQGRNASDT